MTESAIRHDSCRMCKGRDLELVVHLTPTPLAHAFVTKQQLDAAQPIYPLELFLCHTCGYAGMLDVVTREVLWNDSNEVTSRSMGVVEDLRQLADSVVMRIDPPNESLAVDIGSNDGTLLKFFKEHGLRVLGVEPAGYVADMAIASGIPTIKTYFSKELAQQIKDDWGPAKIVTANRVFANIDDLAELTEGIRYLLEPDGIFVFETGYVVDILENDLFETIYHEHLGYDSVKPLASFFRQFNMTMIDIDRLPIKGGSLRGTVQLSGGSWTVSPSVSSMITFEEDLGIHTAAPFKAFTERIDTTKSDLLHILSELKAKGMTIAGYGAAQPNTTMLFHFDLGDKLDFLVDDDPKNQDRFSPGHHIPVLTPDAIYQRNPDYVLILAWRYSEPIIKKHQAYLDQGGHFITPMPKVEII